MDFTEDQMASLRASLKLSDEAEVTPEMVVTGMTGRASRTPERHPHSRDTLTKSELAQQLLREIFAGRTRIPISEAVEAAARAGISRKTITEARKAIGATEIHNGPHPGFWQLTEAEVTR